jgi:outer membrane protein
MKSVSVLILCLGVLSLQNGARADVSIGVVDMAKALESVEAGKEVKSQLQTDFNQKKKELQTEESAIRKATEEFKKQALVMNDEARAKRQGELQERIMKFQEKTGKAQMEIQQKERELVQPIMAKLKGIVGEISKKRNYSLTLDKNENNVLFSLEKDDLTSDVISQFNQQTPAKKAKL